MNTTNQIILSDGVNPVETNNIISYQSITMTDGTTTNTINKTGITTRNSIENATQYIAFVDSSTNGINAIKKTSGLSCNPSTNTITATTFAGDFSGNNLTLSSQLILPDTLTSATFSGNILSCNFGGKSTGIFSATLTASMTEINFSSPRIGGQYVIYVSVTSGGPFTISNTLAGAKTNYTTPVSVTTNTRALLTITYDGIYLIACSAFN